MAGSGEALGSALTMASRTASLSAPPLQEGGAGSVPRIANIVTHVEQHHLHGGAAMTA